MSKAINLLLVEDSEDDAKLAMRELRRGGFETKHERVASAAAMRAALACEGWDAVISDYGMPGFGGLEALEIVKANGCDIPFILISGAVGEDLAVAAMKAGASDYVMKKDLARLAPALKRELKNAANRAARRQAEHALAASELRLRTIIATEPECVKVVSAEGKLIDMNLAGLAMIEAGSLAEAQARPLPEFLLLEHRAAFLELHKAVLRGEHGTLEFEVAGLKGGRRWLETHAAPLPGPNGEATLLGITRDVTARRRADAALRESNEQLRMLVDSSPLAIYTRDREGLLTNWNPAAESMFGWQAAEVLGKPLPSVPEEARAESDRLRMRLLGGEQLINHAGERRRRDGSTIHINSFIGPLRDGAGGTTGIIAVVADVTEQKRAEQALRESEARFRSLTALSSDWYWEQDENFRFVSMSSEVARAAGASAESHIGKTRWELPAAGGSDEAWARHRAGHEAHRPFRDFEYRRINDRGETIWMSASGEPVFDAAGKFKGYRGVGRDITARKRTEERVRRLNRVHAVLSGINALIVRVTDRGELFASACRIAIESGGFRAAWLGIVEPGSAQLWLAASQGLDDDYLRAMPMTQEVNGKSVAPDATGLAPLAIAKKVPVIATDMSTDPRVLLREEALARGFRSLAMLPLVVAGEAVGVLALYAAEVGFFDAEEMKLLEELAGDIAFAIDHIQKKEKLDYLALYDPLTGLANRALFLERLAQQVSAANGEHKLALVLADVERFKAINDALGRQAGDELLRQLAGRLRSASVAGLVTRVGGDRFAIALTRIKGRSEVARTVATFWRDCFAQPFPVGGTELRIGAKAGIALYPSDGKDADALFASAEAALEKAQQSGERFFFHTRELTAGTADQLALENKLRQALERDEFVLHYQPKVDLETRAIVGVEALIRWQSPELGLVPPLKFIPLMEETGLILEAGAWALKRAALDHRRWAEQGLKAPRVAVNVSQVQLKQRDFVASVEQAIIEGLAPTGIDLELTESQIMENVRESIEKLNAIRALGVKLAIDDFGTGYSSLGYLAKLPVQALKIDRSFIVAMLEDADTMALVQTMISLAHSLKLGVVAEGVETEEQARMLRLLRCDQMQGYLISKPVPFEQMTALLRQEKTG